jgi:hypothetical protein
MEDAAFWNIGVVTRKEHDCIGVTKSNYHTIATTMAPRSPGKEIRGSNEPVSLTWFNITIIC